MRRGWKILIGVAIALVVLLGLNAVVTGEQTKPAEVTVEGGEIIELPGGDLQAVESRPPESQARQGSTIVLLHCFTCAIDWWDQMRPQLEGRHRVVAVDLLGHGGSEKPESGYEVTNQADLVAQALGRLGVRDATVVGHSLGGAVAVALAERSPKLVNRLVIIDTSPGEHEGDLGLLAKLTFTPVIGEALWRVKTDSATRQGLEVAFAPGFDVPDAFVEDLDRMTFSAYDAADSYDYSADEPLGSRVERTGKPLLVMMGAEEQIIDDPRAALARYAEEDPGATTRLIPRVGHSPNVEAPALTANLVLDFAAAAQPGKAGKQAKSRSRMHKALQKREDVRKRP
jgi:pimeloyl-ACP methyl ester carboxylesterase